MDGTDDIGQTVGIKEQDSLVVIKIRHTFIVRKFQITKLPPCASDREEPLRPSAPGEATVGHMPGDEFGAMFAVATGRHLRNVVRAISARGVIVRVLLYRVLIHASASRAVQ
ncbi:MAG: hypothetical protein ACJAWL_003366 [Motiliproteus sp.]|jgi:hypothetical protein